MRSTTITNYRLRPRRSLSRVKLRQLLRANHSTISLSFVISRYCSPRANLALSQVLRLGKCLFLLSSLSTYRVFRTSASTGETDILATFVGLPAYLHSLFLTENHVVLCVWNSHFTGYGSTLLYHQNVIQAIAPFDPKSKATWYVVDLCQ